jgi:transposase-like protein
MLQNLVSSSSKTDSKPLSVEAKIAAIKLSDDIGLRSAANQCGIGFSTLGKWRKIYRQHGADALVAKSSRPHHQPKKTHQWIIDKIKSLKSERPEMKSSAIIPKDCEVVRPYQKDNQLRMKFTDRHGNPARMVISELTPQEPEYNSTT